MTFSEASWIKLLLSRIFSYLGRVGIAHPLMFSTETKVPLVYRKITILKNMITKNEYDNLWRLVQSFLFRLIGLAFAVAPTKASGSPVALAKASSSPFDELAEYRQRLGLPPAGTEADSSTIAKLEIAGQTF